MVRNRLFAVVALAILVVTGATPRPLGGEETPLSPVPAALARQSPTTIQNPAPTDVALRRDGFAGPLAARLVRVVDGDTFEARVRVWFGQEVATLVRIRGIDAPELRARCAGEAIRAAAARDLLGDFLGSGAITLRDISADKYFGRVVASVTMGDGDDVADLMLAAAVARPYAGHARAGWCGLDTAAR